MLFFIFSFFNVPITHCECDWRLLFSKADHADKPQWSSIEWFQAGSGSVVFFPGSETLLNVNHLWCLVNRADIYWGYRSRHFAGSELLASDFFLPELFNQVETSMPGINCETEEEHCSTTSRVQSFSMSKMFCQFLHSKSLHEIDQEILDTQ